LTDYLNGDGRYEGLDIMTEPIQRAQAIISKDHPNFRFQVADVYNENYNRHGKFQASEYRFPFPDDTFDVVLLGSVFTHMRPADVDRYLAEIGRVSKPGGRSLVTYFVLNSEALGLIESGASAKKFTHRFDGFRAEDKDIPECAIAYDEEWVRARYAEHRLEIQEPVATVAELVDALERRIPGLREQLDDSVFNFAVNDEMLLFHARERTLQDGDVVEVIPTISGG